jgi:hypothetical protein
METAEQVKNEKLASIGEYEATGLLGMGGFLFYYIGCIFAVADPKHPILRFHADGLGDDFDVDSSEMVGAFTKSPDKLTGKCHFTLENADLEEGAIELTILQDDAVVGVFTGVSEGFGEAILKGTGKLTIPETKEHNNNFTFEGDHSIKSISFDYGDLYTITKGQPWGEVTTSNSHSGSTLKIDIGAGRKESTSNASWYNATVNSNHNQMFHTRGGDNVPSELNFAIKGVLTINNVPFNVCLGQGASGSYNNWHLASESASATHPHKDGFLGNFKLSQSGSSEFKVKKK